MAILTANTSSEVTDLAWDWIRHGGRSLLHYEQGEKAMFPWLHIPGCERIGSLNLTGDLKVKGRRHRRSNGGSLWIYHYALINIRHTTHVWWSTREQMHTHTHTDSWQLKKKDWHHHFPPLKHLSSASLRTSFPLLISISHEFTCNELRITVEHIMEHLPRQWLGIGLSDGHNVKWWGLWPIIFVPYNITAHQSDYSGPILCPFYKRFCLNWLT